MLVIASPFQDHGIMFLMSKAYLKFATFKGIAQSKL
jgi:hypothetical protein